jgi:hypothetical protein
MAKASHLGAGGNRPENCLERDFQHTLYMLRAYRRYAGPKGIVEAPIWVLRPMLSARGGSRAEARDRSWW